MKHREPVLTAGWSLLALIVLSGCEQATPLPTPEQSIRPAQLMQVAPLTTRAEYQFISKVTAARTVDLAFEVAGPLKRLLVREGATVRKGTLLAALDTTDFTLAEREAEVAANLAKQDLTRKRSLLQRRGISQAAVDEAVANAELAQVRLAQAREALADARLTAPFDAYIAQRFVDQHTNVRRGDKVLRLLDLNQVHLQASVPEALMASVTAEQFASIQAQFSFAPEQQFALTYLENSGEADPVAQTFQVTFAMPRPKQWNILPGMTATVQVEVNVPPTAGLQVAIPAAALVTNAEQDFSVWIYDPASQLVTPRAVTLGPAGAAGIVVTGGLQGGDWIVTTGASQLQPGMRVSPLDATQH